MVECRQSGTRCGTTSRLGESVHFAEWGTPCQIAMPRYEGRFAWSGYAWAISAMPILGPELRIDIGPGYRGYFMVEGRSVVMLLCGGDKSTQQKDIRRAREYLTDYRRR